MGNTGCIDDTGTTERYERSLRDAVPSCWNSRGGGSGGEEVPWEDLGESASAVPKDGVNVCTGKLFPVVGTQDAWEEEERRCHGKIWVNRHPRCRRLG
mgnify:CR=1 FL=1